MKPVWIFVLFFYLIFFFRKTQDNRIATKAPFLSPHRRSLGNEKIRALKIPRISNMIVTLNPKILHFSKIHPFSRPSSYLCRTRNVSLITNCKLQKPQDGNQRSSSNRNLTKTISLSDSAPPVTEETGDGIVKGGGNGGGGGGDGRGGLGFLKILPRKVLSVLSNLPLAITEMFTIAALMALGKC